MLRTRLTLGLICLLAILLAMGLYSISSCSQLGQRIEAVVSDNDQAGQNILQMKHCGSAMTGALLTLVAGDTQGSRADFEAASQCFLQALSKEQARASTSPEEKAIIRQLGAAFNDYRAQAEIFLGLVPPANRGDPWRGAAVKLGRQTADLLTMVDRLSGAHLTAVSHRNGSSTEDINNTIRTLILLMLLAVVATLVAWAGTSHGLLAPLRSLTKSIQEVGEGNLEQTVSVLSSDELGVLATSFNRMATQLRQYRSATSAELLRLNTTVRATLASFPDPIFVLNAQGAVEFRNPAADNLALKLLFSGVTRLPKIVDDKVEEVRASGEDYLPTIFADAIKFHIDGQDRYFLPRIVILRDEDGASFGVAVILENVTRLLLLDDVKSNLIATVSHELKTPLTSVRMALYLLVEKTVGPLNEKQADLVATAREDADRLLRTLNDLLDLAKLEQGPSQLLLCEATPAELIEDSIRAAQELALNAGIELRAEVAPDLPSVEVDRQRLAYVFMNLLTNAIKYSPHETIVVIKAQMGENRTGESRLRFAVKDQGPGITPEHQAHIFDRFYRVPGTNKTGAGLGLSIAREIVVAHGGEIGVISRPDEGCEFFFVIPHVE